MGNGRSAAGLFVRSPDRLASAWRRMRADQVSGRELPSSVLDGVVESFVREIGQALAGRKGSAWSRATGVLRLSSMRGTSGLFEEFAILRRCLNAALDAVGAPTEERVLVNAAVDEAVDSSVSMSERLRNPLAPPPRVPFGGLVVEVFDRVAPRPGKDEPAGAIVH